jgi:hypothetical protein
MDVIYFLCVSLGSSTVQLHECLGNRSACACSEAGFSSQNGDRAWGVYYRRAEFCCAFLWAKGLNTKDIHEEMFSVYVGKCMSCKAVQSWVEKCFADDEGVETEVRKWLNNNKKDFYAEGFEAMVKRRSKCYQYWSFVCFYVHLWPIHWLFLVPELNSLKFPVVFADYSPWDAATSVKPEFTPKIWWRGWTTECITWTASSARLVASFCDTASSSACGTASRIVCFTTSSCTTTTASAEVSSWRPPSGREIPRHSTSVAGAAFRKGAPGRESWRLLWRLQTSRSPWGYQRVH